MPNSIFTSKKGTSWTLALKVQCYSCLKFSSSERGLWARYSLQISRDVLKCSEIWRPFHVKKKHWTFLEASYVKVLLWVVGSIILYLSMSKSFYYISKGVWALTGRKHKRTMWMTEIVSILIKVVVIRIYEISVNCILTIDLSLANWPLFAVLPTRLRLML